MTRAAGWLGRAFVFAAAAAVASMASGCHTADALGCRMQHGDDTASCMYMHEKDHAEDRRYDQVDEPGCKRGDPRSCYLAAVYQKNRSFGSGTLRKFEIGCHADIADACYEAGRSLRGTSDQPRGFLLMRRACDLGHRYACSEAALMLPAGNADRDELGARACKLGDDGWCRQLRANP